MIDYLTSPWPWYVAGPLIGLIVPALLIVGNKHFGISANLRHVCAACLPAGIKFFQYEWRREIWNMLFVAGILVGGFVATFFHDIHSIVVHPSLVAELQTYNIKDVSTMLPTDIFSWEALFSLRGLVLLVGGGLLIGFGTRYAGGCTSGHAIMGLSTLQLPSLIATMSFMAGGFIMANYILPIILKL